MAQEADFHINPIDIAHYARSFNDAKPYRFIIVDDFLDSEFCKQVCRAYPDYRDAQKVGAHEFKKADEYRKIQVTDSEAFPTPIKNLSSELVSENFCKILSQITGINNLSPDKKFRGAGMHLMQSGSWLSPHVDFNHLEERLYRRLNLILYLNEDWGNDWGGALEIWDPGMKECMHVVPPIFNRAVIFNTVPNSFHGVLPVECPSGRSRNTFASFYYTDSPPPDWNGTFHGTIWGTRPGEKSGRGLWRKRLSNFISKD